MAQQGSSLGLQGQVVPLPRSPLYSCMAQALPLDLGMQSLFCLQGLKPMHLSSGREDKAPSCSEKGLLSAPLLWQLIHCTGRSSQFTESPYNRETLQPTASDAGPGPGLWSPLQEASISLNAC